MSGAHSEPPYSEEPDWLRASGWQRADEDHPPDEGHPAYRLVYKTLRVVLPSVELSWPNLRVRFGHGTVERGRMTVPGAMQARTPHHWVLPEAGRLVPADTGELRYEPDINMKFNFAAEQDELEDVFYAELLLKTDAAEAAEQLIEGRWKLASLKVMLDLRFGTRLLGLPLTEELGTVFDDWHFNRSLNSELVGAESQLPVAAVQPDEFATWARADMDRYMSRTPIEKERLGLASDWYWTAINANEPVTQFLSLWFAVEVLAMENTTNVRPVRERLAAEIGGDESDWADLVGRLYGKRSRLAHGDEPRRVTDRELADVRALTETLLQAEAGTVDRGRATYLRTRAAANSR
jgi:Apea-like HEPN